MKIRIINLLEEKCASNDEYIAYVAAQGLRSEILDAKNEIIDFSFLKKHIQNWPLPQYYETKIEFEKTFRYFQGEDRGSINSLKLEIPHNNPIDFAFLETKKNQSNTYTFKTNKGNFKMEFNYDQAPGTAIYIAKLIEEGFYNGKKFHRVIPNFVAQGGCPRGDGVGSTDKSLRSEFTYLEYEEGSVGMASAGRDTESCQFFITHHDVPHLNGRYTIFAKVVEGMDVVHKLTVGDTINEIVW
ncbi:MAG: peptidylprolyl isomerase [Bacteroidetes bacterium]|nr:peptidylprolyl isomerase [Bacteroidota bacterium]